MGSGMRTIRPGMAKPLGKLASLLTPKRRWAQFSLGTMFIVVSLLCVWLALLVNQAHRQRAAVAAIEKLGGIVGYGEPAIGDWLPTIARDAFVPVVDVNFFKCAITDDDLACLDGLHQVEFISLGDTA